MFTLHIHKAIYTCNKRDCIDVDIYNIIPFLLQRAVETSAVKTAVKFAMEIAVKAAVKNAVKNTVKDAVKIFVKNAVKIAVKIAVKSAEVHQWKWNRLRGMKRGFRVVLN